MKVYRVLPYDKIRYEREILENYKKLEDVYYSMGYIPFDVGNTVHTSNNIYKELPNKSSEIGKYFFLYPEDAINNADTLNYIHDINGSSIFLTEYEIPLELILKYIGYGDYSGDLFHKKNYCLECFLTLEDLGYEIIDSQDICENLKMNTFIKSIDNLIKNGTSVIYYPDFYRKIFNITNLNIMKNNPNIIKRHIKENPFLLEFIESDVSLIKCPFITDKIIQIDCEKLLLDCGSPKYIADYFKKYDIDVNFTKEHRLFKQHVLKYVGTNKQKKDKEMVRKLLK